MADESRAFRITFSERLAWLLDEFANRAEASEAAGVTADQLAKYVRGGAKPSLDTMARLCEARGVSLDWLAYGRGPRRIGANDEMLAAGVEAIERGDAVAIPLYEVRAGAGVGQLAWQEQTDTRVVFPRAMLNRIGVSARGARLIQAKGDSMEPAVVDGALMLVDTHDIEPREDIFVLRYGDSILVKRLQRKLDGTLVLRSDNPIYGEEELRGDAAHELQIIGRVRWVFRPV